MLNKHNSPRRRHIPKMKFRVNNWAEYDAGLRRRGSLTLCVTPEVLDGWRAARRTNPGGQTVFSELAIANGMRLRLAVDANTRMIMASTLTGNDVGDPSQVAPLLDQIETTIASVTADGAYDGMPTYDVVAGYGEDVRVIIPPHVTAVLSAQAEHNPSQRDQHILLNAAQGRMGWQKETDYGQRALVETAMGRYKAIIGPRLRGVVLG